MTSNSFVYVTNTDSDDISVVSIDSFEEIERIPVGGSPRGSVRFDKQKKFAYVSNCAGNTISVIDIDSNKEVDKITVGLAPRGLILSDDSTYAFVSNSGDGTLSIIDLTTRQQLSKRKIGSNPRHMAKLPGKDTILVSVWGDDRLAQFSFGMGIAAAPDPALSVSVGSNARPYSVAVNSAGDTAYVANTQADYISKIDVVNEQEIARVTVGFGSRAIVLSADNKYAFVSVECPNQVAVVDLETNSVVRTVDVGPSPRGIAIDLPTNTLFGGSFGRSVSQAGARNSIYAIDVSDPLNARYMRDTPVGLGPCSVSVLRK